MIGSFIHITRLLTGSVMTTLLAAVMAACVTDPEPGSLIADGARIPQFTVTMDDGSQLSTDDLAGKQSIIMFFSTTCPDCRHELPVVEQFHRLRPDVTIVAIARDESEGRIAEFWRENNLTLPYSPQTDRKIYNLFATEGIPRVYIVSPDLTVMTQFDDTDMPSLERLLEIFS